MKTVEQIGAETLARLAAQTARNRESGAALRAQIRTAMATYTGSERLTARRMRVQLLRTPAPSIRTIQQHMRAIRAESSASRLLLIHPDTHGNSHRIVCPLVPQARLQPRRE